MNKMLSKIVLGLLALTGATLPLAAAVSNTKTLSGHVPAVVSQLAPLNHLAATNQMRVSIHLLLRNTNEMDTLIEQVISPSSPKFRHWLTTEQFAAQFGPTDQDVQAVVSFAQANHLQVVATHASHMVVELTGQASDVEQAFNVTLNEYQHPTEARTFYSPDREPSVSSSLPVLSIGGLETYYRPKSRITRNLTPVTKAGSGTFGNYMGYDFRAAYVPGTTLTGAGQKVALFQADGYDPADVTAYLQRSGLPAVPVTNILLQGFSGNPTFGGQGEVVLDIDMVNSMAPGLSQILVYEGTLSPYDPMLIFSRIASDNAAPVVSCSWGWTGGPNARGIDQVFKQMILQGQSVFDASGDVDAFLPPGTPNGFYPGSVDDPFFFNAPSDNPYMIQVGGTTLNTTGPSGALVSETVWNWGFGLGSSGGISGYYAMPAWQQGVSMTNNGGSTTMRNLPDVAMVADNIDIIVDGVDNYGTGGTSAAAPLWAGLTALANQQSVARGGSTLGFLNPLLYSLGKSANYSSYFWDVTVGDNTSPWSPNLFYAVPGYDLCTGFGSPKGTNLINALINVPAAPIFPPPLQPWGNTLAVHNGSDPNGYWMLYFQDDTSPYSGTNYNGWAVNLTAANPLGLAADNQIYINATNVTLAPGAQWSTVLAVTNYGPSVSSNVFVVANLPASPGVSLLNATPSVGSVNTNSGILVWTLGNLGVNAGGTLTLSFQANLSGSYTNTASVNASTPDPNPDDDTVSLVASVASSTPPVIGASYTAGAGGAFVLSVLNNAGSSTIIQASTNLLSWLPIYTNFAPFTYTNFDTTNFPKRFYRAVLGP